MSDKAQPSSFALKLCERIYRLANETGSHEQGAALIDKALRIHCKGVALAVSDCISDGWAASEALKMAEADLARLRADMEQELLGADLEQPATDRREA